MHGVQRATAEVDRRRVLRVFCCFSSLVAAGGHVYVRNTRSPSKARTTVRVFMLLRLLRLLRTSLLRHRTHVRSLRRAVSSKTAKATRAHARPRTHGKRNGAVQCNAQATTRQHARLSAVAGVRIFAPDLSKQDRHRIFSRSIESFLTFCAPTQVVARVLFA